MLKKQEGFGGVFDISVQCEKFFKNKMKISVSKVLNFDESTINYSRSVPLSRIIKKSIYFTNSTVSDDRKWTEILF